MWSIGIGESPYTHKVRDNIWVIVWIPCPSPDQRLWAWEPIVFRKFNARIKTLLGQGSIFFIGGLS